MLYLANNRLLLINNGNSLYRIEGEEPAPVGDDPFIFTIDTTLGTGSSFNLPLRSGYNYDMLVDWGDGSSDVIKSYNQAEKLHTYSTGGEYQISITGLCEAWSFFNNNDCLKLTSIDQWGDVGFINMMNAFYGCSNLTTVNDTDGTWCSNVTNMYSMFFACSSLTTLDFSNWDVSNVTDMYGMFYNCLFLETLDVSNWDVSNVSDVDVMFDNCSSLVTLDVSNWNGFNVTYMFAMFSNCSSLTTLDVSNWDVSNVKYMNQMFSNCSSLTTLDVSKWDVSNVSDMGVMFYGCESLTTLDVSNWNVSNVTNMNAMFYNTPLDTTSYDALLNGWSGLPSLQPNVPFTANLAKYSCAAEEAHDTLTSSPNNWNITDLGLNVANCDEPVGGDEFKFTINTNLGTGASMTLPLRSGYNYNMTVDWGDGNSSTVTSSSDSNRTHNYATHGTYQISISGTCTAWGGSFSIDRLKLISIDQWGSTGFINMEQAFISCSNLTTLNDSNGTWCSGVTNMNDMFYMCTSLTTLNASAWDVGNVTGMSDMFRGCSSLEMLDLSGWNTSKVNNMSYIFAGCALLNDISSLSSWDVSNVTSLMYSFGDCAAITDLSPLSSWDVSNVTDMFRIFHNCDGLTDINITNWKLNYNYGRCEMFYSCNNLTGTTGLDTWNMSNIDDLGGMFAFCYSLIDISPLSNWDVSNVTKFDQMFNATSLTNISALSNWNIVNANTFNLTFYNVNNVSSSSYDDVLIGWSQLPTIPNGIYFEINANYTSAGQVGRNILTSSPNNWIINDGTLV